MALNDRKGGMVARVRVSPKDCLGIMDLIDSMGIDPYQHSFSGCVSLALSSLIAVARKGGIIKADEDGFQYLNRLEPFMGQASTKVKRERTNAMYERAVYGLSAPMPPQQPQYKVGDIIPVRQEYDKERLQEEYDVLKSIIKSGQELTAEQWDRFGSLQNILY